MPSLLVRLARPSLSARILDSDISRYSLRDYHFGRDIVPAKLDFKPRQWKFRRTVAAAENDE